ncbi:flagellar hook assembly protein FlgD [Stakelama tenebrarum]|uniref:Basal-body rod modification protein FlgD n=1 Tax=Stakelama tenebrarum TaxID=2711215 RepID=A0A6G6Y425_9SPHN|nr:flagellar hook assembly protein FlgD [Sphingosinithalassobacter tenebrarum]QIG79682.1 flagellar hook assembly protein FlgD [Sphingosinithalassobacter tenebrarum]
MTTVASSTGAPAAATGGSALSGLNADFDMFLKLLTSQMQNQDPLDPMDTSEYTQQLVQYSQVEQSIKQTETLQQILSAMGSSDLVQASSLLGREVEFDSATAALSDSAPASWSWSASRNVASVAATVKDANGRVVATGQLQPGSSGRFDWDGMRANGSLAPAGSYTLELSGADANGSSVPITVRGTGTVRDVHMIEGTVTLNVNGAEVPADRLLRIGG